MSDEVPFESIAIIGFGLIGASIASAMRKRHPSVRLAAVDRPAVVSDARASALVDETASVQDATAVRALVKSHDLTVLAAPVGVIMDQLPELLALAQCVTDCGSTKREICDVAKQTPHAQRFVPGHPMAGRHVGGFLNADPDLYVQRKWILCDTAGTDPARVEHVSRWVGSMGAHPVRMSPEEHDAAVALTSHLPQLLASLLVTLNQESGSDDAAGPGFASATRVAGGDERMWRDIFATNADEIARAARTLGTQLSSLADQLSHRSLDGTTAVLRNARRLREGAAEPASADENQ